MLGAPPVEDPVTAPIDRSAGTDDGGLGLLVPCEVQRDLPADLRLPVDWILAPAQRRDVKRTARATGMVRAVVEDARAAVQARVDAIALEARLPPWVPAAARQRDPAVLPVLVAQLPDTPADLLEIIAAGGVAVALIDLHALGAAAARGAFQPGIRASASPDAPVVGQHERQVKLPAPPGGVLERNCLAREHQDRPQSMIRSRADNDAAPIRGSPIANAIVPARSTSRRHDDIRREPPHAGALVAGSG